MKIKYLILMMILIMGLATAAFNPRNDIDLKDTYGIYGATYINSSMINTIYYVTPGDASDLTTKVGYSNAKVIIPCGTYNVNSLSVGNNLLIEGSGECTILDGDSNNMFNLEDNSNVYIQNLKIIDSDRAFYIINSEDIYIYKNYINQTDSQGIYIGGSSSSENIYVLNNKIHNTDFSGLSTISGQVGRLIIRDNEFVSNDLNGTTAALILYNAGSDSIVEGNIVRDSNSRGIQIGHGGVTINRISTTNNQIYNSGEFGIQLWECDNCIVSGNTVNGTEKTGFYFLSSSQLNVHDNYVFKAKQHGFWLVKTQRSNFNDNYIGGVSGEGNNLYDGFFIEDDAITNSIDNNINDNYINMFYASGVKGRYGINEANTTSNNNYYNTNRIFNFVTDRYSINSDSYKFMSDDGESNIYGNLDVESLNNIYYVEVNNSADLLDKWENLPDYSTLIVPMGYYVINESINMPDKHHVQYIGLGYPEIDFQYSGSTDMSIYFQDGAGDYITIEGFILNNSQESTIIFNADFVNILDNIVLNSERQGINGAGQNIIISNNKVRNVESEFGIVLGGYVNHGTITNNQVYNTTAKGIQWGYSGENVVISDNIIELSNGGIEVYGRNSNGYNYTKNIIISNNNIINAVSDDISDYGIRVATKPNEYSTHLVSNVKVSDNTIFNNITGGERGIFVGKVDNIDIVNNHVTKTDIGIQINDVNGTRIFVEDNIVLDSATQGITITPSNVLVRNNYIDNVTFDGIFLSTTSENNTFIGNIIKNYGRDYIRNLALNNQNVVNLEGGNEEPYVCSSTTTSNIWYDKDDTELKQCDGLSWKVICDDTNNCNYLSLSGGVVTGTVTATEFAGDLNGSYVQNMNINCSADTYVTGTDFSSESLICSGISDVYLLNSGDTGTGDYTFVGNLSLDDGNGVNGHTRLDFQSNRGYIEYDGSGSTDSVNVVAGTSKQLKLFSNAVEKMTFLSGEQINIGNVKKVSYKGLLNESSPESTSFDLINTGKVDDGFGASGRIELNFRVEDDTLNENRALGIHAHNNLTGGQTKQVSFYSYLENDNSTVTSGKAFEWYWGEDSDGKFRFKHLNNIYFEDIYNGFYNNESISYSQISTEKPEFNIDLDADNNETGELLKITKDNGTTTLFELDENGDVELLRNLNSVNDVIVKGDLKIRETDLGFNGVVLNADSNNGDISINGDGTTNVLLQGYGVSYFNAGNVCIGSTSCSDKLSVNGDISATEATFSGDLNVGSDTLFVDQSTGRVSVGFTLPATVLDVRYGTSLNNRFQVGSNLSTVTNINSDSNVLLINDANNDNSVIDLKTGTKDWYMIGGNNMYFQYENTPYLTVDTSLNSIFSGDISQYTTNPIHLIQDSETSLSLADSRLRFGESGAGGSLGTYWDIGGWNNNGNFSFNINTSLVSGNVFSIKGETGNANFLYNLDVDGSLTATDYYSGDGTQGFTGSCASGTTLTVKDGLITACS